MIFYFQGVCAVLGSEVVYVRTVNAAEEIELALLFDD
jgi:hypothetical protein